MRIISSLLLAFSFPVVVTAAEKPFSLATELADHYLKSFGQVAIPLVPPAKEENQLDANVADIHLSPRAERAVVFNEIFAKSDLYQARYKEAGKLLNPYVWSDLHLFCGTTATPDYHFLSRINKTITVLGEAALASFIGAPISNIETLKQRQRLISFFCQNSQVYNDVTAALKNYKKSETALLSFWTPTDPLYNKKYMEYLTKLFYTNSSTSNKSASLLQTKKIWLRDIWDIYASYIFYPVLGLASTEIFYQSSNRILRGKFYQGMYPQYIPIWGIYKANQFIKELEEKEDKPAPLFKILGAYGPPVFNTLHSLYQYYKGYVNYNEYAAVLNNLALRMADLQTFLLTAKEINRLVQQNPQLAALYSKQIQPISLLLARLNESSEVGNLLSYLESLPLRSWSYLWSNAGKLLASYKLFVEHKAVFHDALYALGELDAFVGMATLMQETAAINGPHRYTFTKFLSPKLYTKPRLALVEMWNAMLTPTTAVGNDVTMDSATKSQNIILTGPNAGGKSTFVTGVATTVLLSQTFGIAPAKSCQITPFSKINTYINVVDDIAAGKSLFMAEVDRFHSHLKLLKQLKEKEFSFTIFDEPFNGTNPEEGAAAEYSVLNYIGAYSNAFNIVATHYPIVMLLEKREPQKGFKNYKVFIKPMGKDGKIHYTYKVIPGASNQAIAIDILAEQGYATEMLEEARDIISHPERYKKSFTK